MKKDLLKITSLVTGLLFMSFFPLLVAADNTGEATLSGGQLSASGATSRSDDKTSIEGGKFATSRFKTTVSLREGYDDNVFTAHDNKVDSFFTNLYGSIFANLGNERTQFTIGLSGGVTEYYSRPGNKFDENATLTFNMVHKVNPRLTLSWANYATYQAEPSFDLQVAQNRRNGQYYYLQDALSASYQWSERFQTVTGYKLVGIFYQNSAPSQTEDRLEHTFSNQFRFLLQPTTTLVGEYRLGLVQYLHQASRDTISNYFLAGVDHSFSPKFTVSLRGGAQLRSVKEGSNDATPYFEANARYAYRRYSSLGWFLHYGYDNGSITATNQTHKNLTTGIRLNHGFTPRLSAYLAFFYQHDNLSQTFGSLTNDTFDISTGINFTVTPKLTLQAGFTRTQLISNTASQKYDRDVVSIGGTYQF